MKPLEPDHDILVVLPDFVRDHINKRLDELITKDPEAAADRDYLYNQILGHFAITGEVPEFTIKKIIGD